MGKLELIKKLTTSVGISGDESAIRQIMIDELGNLTDYEIDKMGSIHFKFKGSSDKPKIIFLAHQDEIGFIVADIRPQGFLSLQAIGGWDVNTLQSSPVEIISSNGERICGVIGSVPVHFSRGNKKELLIENLLVDIGAIDREDVINNFGIELGNPIIPITNFHYEERNKRIFSKAFDDRIGIAAVIELGKRIAKKIHPNEICISGSVQEEVGTRGAKTIANYLEADLAIIIEGAPADDLPSITQNPQTSVGKGAHLRLYDPTLIAPKNLTKYIINLAKQKNIPIQPAVRRRGGTDAREIHTANFGIPSVVVGVPVRYAHSHNGMISLDDFDNLVDLMENIVVDFSDKTLVK